MVLDQMLSGDLDIDRLNQSFIRFVNDHLILRSNVSSDSEAPCWIQKESIRKTSHPLVYHPAELSETEIMAIVLKPFDLENDPLVRLHAIRLKDDRVRILYILHHIVIDGLSYRSVLAEHSKYYNDSAYSNPTSVTEQRRLHRELASRFIGTISENRVQMNEFWRTHLEGVAGENLAFLRVKAPPSTGCPPGCPKNRVGEFRFHFKDYILAKVKRLGRPYRVTPYVFGQIVFGILLHRMGGKNNVGVSFPIAITEGKDLIYGAHINSLIIDFRYQENTTAVDLIRQALVYYDELKANRAKYLPIYEIMRYSTTSSLLDASFIQTDLKDVPMAYEGISKVEICHSLNIDLPNKLLFEQESLPTQLNYRVRYDKEELSTELVRSFVASYRTLFIDVLDSLLDGRPVLKVADYKLLSPPQRDRILHRWNATNRGYSSDKTIHGLFEEQVQKTPDCIALVYDDLRLTYRQLNERANQLAAYLQVGYPIKPDNLIALCLDRSEHLIVAILAVLKVGAAYVPLDPANPDGRIQFILADTGALIVLTDETNRDRLQKVGTNTAIAIECINGAGAEAVLASQLATNPASAVQPSNLFYVVYTSGTTDKPKGVLIEHRHISPIVDAIREAYDFQKPSRITAFTSFGFDVSTSEFFVSLLNGNELHLLPERLRADVGALSEYLIANEIEFAYLPPAVLAALPKKDYAHLTTIIYAGEPCDPETGRYWSLRKRLFNYYGPTETNIATGKLIENGDVHLIGRPVANAKVYVLDRALAPVPTGAVGEIYLGGAAVARGYLNCPELTSERFLANPFQTIDEAAGDRNARLYKTGDLARYLPDGNLEFIGRNDSQIKVRGYRIEMGEIEAQLAKYPGIEQAVVIAREQRPVRSKYLAAYYVAEKPIEEQLVLSHLRDHLPDYMIPSVLARIDKVPLTINGKVDRNALPKLEPSRERLIVPSENAMQAQLCALYAEILELERSQIGIDDDFFRFGGTSILSFKLISKLKSQLNVSISPAILFASRTIRQLSREMAKGGHSGIQIASCGPAGAEHYPLSFAQERLWFIHSYQGGGDAYNIPVAFKLKRSTCVESFLHALQSIVKRHEVLRTYFRTTSEGVGCQVVQRDSEFALNLERVQVFAKRELEEAIDDSFCHSFDLANEPPLKVTIFELNHVSEPKAVFIGLVIHHIAFDGWSAEIMIRELLGFYRYHESVRIGGVDSASLPEPLTIQYKEFASWQRGYMSGEVLAAQLDYWKNHLVGCESLQLPLDHPRPSKVDYAGADVPFEIDPEASEQLRAVARELEVSLYSVLFSGYYILLSAFANQRDIVVGIPMANRHHAELQDTIGFFANTLVLRQVMDREERIAAFIKRVSDSVIQAQGHQDLPFERLVSEMNVQPDSSRHPLFQVMFGLHELGRNHAIDELFEIHQTQNGKQKSPARFDLTTMMSDRGAEITGFFNYATSLFEEATIYSLIATYKEILTQIAGLSQTPNQTIRDLRYLDRADHQKVIYDWNATQRPFPSDKTVHQLFEEQVERAPERIAVVCGNIELTYGQLNARSNQLAHYLRAHHGLEPDARIALLLERTEQMLIAMLAVLKAGAAYVPIDPNAPQERIGHLLKDSGAKMLLANETHAARVADGIPGLLVVAVDSAGMAQELLAGPTDNPLTPTQPHHLCYVIYTSGTTGQPKGVMVEHRGVVNLAIVQDSLVKFEEGEDRCLWYANYVFDAHVAEIFPTLLQGHRLFIPNIAARADTQWLGDYIKRNQIELAIIPPALLDHHLLPLKRMIVAGEVANPEWMKRYHEQGIHLINGYGPTEVTVCATSHHYGKDSSHTNIGRPIANATAYVLNDDLTPLPLGAVGELYVGGVGVARGYLNRPELTQERFLINPFQTPEEKAEHRNGRFYKTGDLVRYWPDGNLEFLGRNDFQIKIRGYRIEPGEIEARMVSLAGIKQALVIAWGQDAAKYLAGYYVADAALEPEALRAYLSEQLPEYMVPAALVRLAQLPLTVNGKVDRQALPEPEQTGGQPYQAPENTEQEQLCRCFAQVLGLEKAQVGIDDDFFRLGGNSILAIQLVHRINQALAAGISLAALFTCKTVRQLAAQVRRLPAVIRRLNDTEGGPALFMIHPGLAGCEVYNSLAKRLSEKFRCFGVDSHNLYHTEMISDLNRLARYYLARIDEVQRKTVGETYFLLGWSLGGQIALEIAALLEARGVKNIQVVLLDTVLSDEWLNRLRTAQCDLEIQQVIKSVGNAGVHTEDYKAFFDTESELSSQPISRSLQHTRVLLFKAMQSDERMQSRESDRLADYVKGLEFNNVDKCLDSARQITVVKLERAHHWNLLDSEQAISFGMVRHCAIGGTRHEEANWFANGNRNSLSSHPRSPSLIHEECCPSFRAKDDLINR
jgi:amino acid adenylation domain-containing protein